MCKTPLEHVYVFESPQSIRPFSSLQIWGTNAGPGIVFDDRAQVHTYICTQKNADDELTPPSPSQSPMTACTPFFQMFMPKAFHEDVFQVLQAFICRAPGCGYARPSSPCDLTLTATFQI